MPLRHDLFAEYRASGSDVPFEAWLRERDALERERWRQSSDKPTGWAVSLAMAIVLGSMLVTFCVVIAALLKGHW